MYFHVADSTCDLTITPDEDQYVLWAIGGIEQTAFKHFIRTEGISHTVERERERERERNSVIYKYG